MSLVSYCLHSHAFNMQFHTLPCAWCPTCGSLWLPSGLAEQAAAKLEERGFHARKPTVQVDIRGSGFWFFPKEATEDRKVDLVSVSR